MTNIDEINTIETIAIDKKGNILFILMEQRKWKDIKDSDIKLNLKIANARIYAISEEFEKKYKNKKPIIRLYTVYEPPEEIKKILKKEGIEYELIN